MRPVPAPDLPQQNARAIRTASLLEITKELTDMLDSMHGPEDYARLRPRIMEVMANIPDDDKVWNQFPLVGALR
jgi:hypothetical protein